VPFFFAGGIQNFPPLFFHFFFFLISHFSRSQISRLCFFFRRKIFVFVWPIVSRTRESKCIFFSGVIRETSQNISLFRLFTVRRFKKQRRSATTKKQRKTHARVKEHERREGGGFYSQLYFYIVKNERHARRDDALFLCGNDPLRFFF